MAFEILYYEIFFYSDTEIILGQKTIFNFLIKLKSILLKLQKKILL